MNNVTTIDRVNFLADAAKAFEEYDAKVPAIVSNLTEQSKKINVSAVYRCINLIEKYRELFNGIERKANEASLDILKTFKDNKYNTGEIKDEVEKAKKIISNSTPVKYEANLISEDSNGEENITATTIGNFADTLREFSTVGKELVYSLSAAAKKVKGDTNAACINIGKVVEKGSNESVLLFNKLSVQLDELCRDYQIELATIEDISNALRSVGTNLEEDTNIAVGSISF